MPFSYQHPSAGCAPLCLPCSRFGYQVACGAGTWRSRRSLAHKCNTTTYTATVSRGFTRNLPAPPDQPRCNTQHGGHAGTGQGTRGCEARAGRRTWHTRPRARAGHTPGQARTKQDSLGHPRMIQPKKGQTAQADKLSLVFPRVLALRTLGYAVCALVTKSGLRAHARLYCGCGACG